jgi:intracellular sulfur oxidation DsrE/DsrF family protein
MSSGKIERRFRTTRLRRRHVSKFQCPIPNVQNRKEAKRSVGGAVRIGVAIVLGVSVMASASSAQVPSKQERAKTSDAATQAMHRVAIQVNQNDKSMMDLALNNAKNVIDYYASKNESVAVEVVTYGPGLHMLRSDTSPVKDRIAVMSLENTNLTFAACGNTQANQSKAENKPIVLIGEAKVTPSGVVRLMELQKQGYAYIRP